MAPSYPVLNFPFKEDFILFHSIAMWKNNLCQSKQKAQTLVNNVEACLWLFCVLHSVFFFFLQSVCLNGTSTAFGPHGMMTSWDSPMDRHQTPMGKKSYSWTSSRSQTSLRIVWTLVISSAERWTPISSQTRLMMTSPAIDRWDCSVGIVRSFPSAMTTRCDSSAAE